MSPFKETLRLSYLGSFLGGAFQNSEDLILAHDQEFFSINADLTARILAEQDAVALFHVQWNYFAVLQALAFSTGYNFSFLRLLFGGIGDKQPANLVFLLVFNAFHDEPVIERSNVHSV